MYGRPRSRRRTHLALERHRLVPAVISNGSGGSLYYFRSDQVPRLVAYRGSHRSCRAHQADERPLLPQCYARSRDDLAERRDQRSRSGHGACPIHGDGTHVEPPLSALTGAWRCGHGDDRTGNLSARYVLAVMIGVRRGRVSERKLRRESLPIANGARESCAASRLMESLAMLIEGSSLRRRDT